jgi:hypothetical protein
MKLAVAAAIIFVAGIWPGLSKHDESMTGTPQSTALAAAPGSMLAQLAGKLRLSLYFSGFPANAG